MIEVTTLRKKNWLLTILCNLDLLIATVALIVLTLVTSGGVFMRYVVKNPILWQEEVSAFCQVWMVFLGASVCFRQCGHVAIEMVVDALPEKAQKIANYVIDIIVLCVLVYLAINAQAYITQVFGRSNRPTPILRIPYKVLYGVAPVSCWLMIVSHFVGKYAPAFVKDIELDFSAKEGK